jgi:serine/threonine protein kinase
MVLQQQPRFSGLGAKKKEMPPNCDVAVLTRRHKHRLSFTGDTQTCLGTCKSHVTFSTPDDHAYVQEFCNGGSVRNLLVNGAFAQKDMVNAWSTTMKAVKSIAAGMKYVHAKRICHGDLNPSNILLKVILLRFMLQASNTLHTADICQQAI